MYLVPPTRDTSTPRETPDAACPRTLYIIPCIVIRDQDDAQLHAPHSFTSAGALPGFSSEPPPEQHYRQSAGINTPKKHPRRWIDLESKDQHHNDPIRCYLSSLPL